MRVLVRVMSLKRLTFGHVLAAHFLPLWLATMVQDHRHRGRPLLELVLPVGQGGKGSDDDEGSTNALLPQVRQKAHCLYLQVTESQVSAIQSP